MKLMKCLTLAAVAAGLGVASMGAGAAESTMNNKCADLVFHKEFLDKYPRSPAVCRSVSVKNGVKSAKFGAKVVGLEKGSIKVQFLNVVGDPVGGMEPLTITPKEGATLSVNGKLVKYRDLKVGDSLNFYVSENRVAILTDPEEAGDK